ASSSQASIPTTLKNFSMSQRDKALQEFVQDQWLCDTANGKFGLGVRSFLDLWSWFHNNEVPLCYVCNEAGIKVLCELKVVTGAHFH
ncbi:non-structural maintenance of chromosomes element 1, partial [Tanacetum coccineum]